MCGRFSQSKDVADVLKRFQADLAADIVVKPRYNLAPTQDAEVIFEDEKGHRKLHLMKWDLARSWSKEPKGKPLINLRAETVLQRGFFNKLLQKNRCLVPVDGYYEWKDKAPFRFVLKDGDLMGLCGLYKLKLTPDGKAEYYFSLITTDANSVASQIHNRQPAIVPPAKEAIWLNPSARQYNYVDCLGPSPAGEMHYYPVSTLLNSAKNDSLQLIQPLVKS